MTYDADGLPFPDSQSWDGPLRPDPFCGGREALEAGQENDISLWSHPGPNETPFMMVSLLDRLLHRPYHSAIVHGPFDARRLALDYAKRVFRSQTMINQKGRKSVEQLLLVLDSGLFAFFDGMVLTLYAGSPEAADAAARDFRKYVRPSHEEKAHCFVVRVSETGAVAEPVEVERSAPITTQDLRLYYGEEFVAWTDNWLRQVQERPSGLTVLYGPPGVGKTSFLRALMHRLLDRAAFYYLPASEAQLLSSPRFVGCMCWPR